MATAKKLNQVNSLPITLVEKTLSELQKLPSALLTEQAEINEKKVSSLKSDLLKTGLLYQPIWLASLSDRLFVVSGRHRLVALTEIEEQNSELVADTYPCIVFTCKTGQQLTELIIKANESRRMATTEKKVLAQSARLDFNPVDTTERFITAIERTLTSYGTEEAIEALLSRLSADFAKDYGHTPDAAYSLYSKVFSLRKRGGTKLIKDDYESIISLSHLVSFAMGFDKLLRQQYDNLKRRNELPITFARDGVAMVAIHSKAAIDAAYISKALPDPTLVYGSAAPKTTEKPVQAVEIDEIAGNGIVIQEAKPKAKGKAKAALK